MRMDEGTMLRRKLVRNVQLSLSESYANCDYTQGISYQMTRYVELSAPWLNMLSFAERNGSS